MSGQETGGPGRAYAASLLLHFIARAQTARLLAVLHDRIVHLAAPLFIACHARSKGILHSALRNIPWERKPPRSLFIRGMREKRAKVQSSFDGVESVFPRVFVGLKIEERKMRKARYQAHGLISCLPCFC